MLDNVITQLNILNNLKLNELHKYQTSICLYKTLFNNYDQELKKKLIQYQIYTHAIHAILI